jgi:tetratricopeptide (TPR) repeat protein
MSGTSPRPASERATPDPGQARTLDDLIETLRLLKLWAGDPSYGTITTRINAAWTAAGRPAGELTKRTTVADCFRPGRRRLNHDLFLAIVEVLHPDRGYLTQWRQALRVVGEERNAVSQVRVLDALPPDVADFTGRAFELDRLHRLARDASAVVVSALAGMAGVGKTQLAVHAGHLLLRAKAYDRVLFVNLRGFHPDATQPPADPSAALEGFLRILGVPGQQIPHELGARAAMFQEQLTGTRTLVVLDDAADADQVRPLVPAVSGCLALITSRRELAELSTATRLTVDVFSPTEAVAFLRRAVPDAVVGADTDAVERIALRCGYLPLALSLLAGRIRNTPHWTLSDHAERLDECHRDRRLDSGVELALYLSYRDLPAAEQRLLRLVALHPGQDLDVYAAAAIAGADLGTTRVAIDHLCDNHLIQRGAPGRYTLHDLVRAYAVGRAGDEDTPSQRRAALERLFDHYLAVAARAMDMLHPAEAHRRPPVLPLTTPAPSLDAPDAALEWLNTERPILVSVAAHTAAHGWPTHAVMLSRILFNYLDGVHRSDAYTIHLHACDAARGSGDSVGYAHALTNLATAERQVGGFEAATERYGEALTLFRRAGDQAGQARVLGLLGLIEERRGAYQSATEHYRLALEMFERVGDSFGEANALIPLGTVQARLGQHTQAAALYRQALEIYRQIGDRVGEAAALNVLGEVSVHLGRPEQAIDYLRQALNLCRQVGDRYGEASTLDTLGILHTDLGQPAEATEQYQHALAILRDIGEAHGEAHVLNSLGETARAGGQLSAALAHHTAAHAIAESIGARYQQARAQAGLGHVHRGLGDLPEAHRHFEAALEHYVAVGTPEADEIRAYLVGESRPTA